MSKETAEWLNRYILIGNVKNRPRAWHDDPRLRQRLGLPSNHFDDPIPYKTVVERLFPWQPMVVPTANLIPCKKSESDYVLPQQLSLGGETFDKGTPCKIVVVPDMQGIVRSDNYLEVGHHSEGYRVHNYEAWLLKLLSNVIGDELTILGAGLLRNGAQAFVQVALPKTHHDNTSGAEFWPYIMCSTSLDGSIATTFSGQTLFVVCDNTRNIALHQGEKSGRIYKARHTSGSLDVSAIKDVRQALRIIHQTGDDMMKELAELSSIKVTPRQWNKFMDTLPNPLGKFMFKIPNPKEATAGAITAAENRRDMLDHTYRRNEMAAQWTGTALGVIQAVNTYETHYRTVKGNRVERNLDKAIRGQFSTTDRLAVSTLANVLGMPELTAISKN